MGLHGKLSNSMLGFCLVWAFKSLCHAVTIAGILYVQLPCCVWKALFPWRELSPFQEEVKKRQGRQLSDSCFQRSLSLGETTEHLYSHHFYYRAIVVCLLCSKAALWEWSSNRWREAKHTSTRDKCIAKIKSLCGDQVNVKWTNYNQDRQKEAW